MPLHKREKVKLAPFKVGVEIFMDVGSVSCPNLGFPEAVHMKLPHKTCERLSFEDFQRQHLNYDQILLDDDSVTVAVPDDAADFTVVDQMP